MENETEGGNGKEGTLTPSAQDAIGDAAKANVSGGRGGKERGQFIR